MLSATSLEQVQAPAHLEAQSAGFARATCELRIERLQSLDRTARCTRPLRPPSHAPSETTGSQHRRTRADDLRDHGSLLYTPMISAPLRRPERVDRDTRHLRNRFTAETLAECHVAAATRDFGATPGLGVEFRCASCQMKSSGVSKQARPLAACVHVVILPVARCRSYVNSDNRLPFTSFVMRCRSKSCCTD